MSDGLLGKLQRAFEGRIGSIEEWIKNHKDVPHGTSIGDEVSAELAKLKGEIQAIKMRMGRSKEVG